MHEESETFVEGVTLHRAPQTGLALVRPRLCVTIQDERELIVASFAVFASARSLLHAQDDRTGRDDSRALSFVRLALARAAIGRLDDDAGAERPACQPERGGRENLRWRASLRSLPCRRRRQKIGKEVRGPAANGEIGFDLSSSATDVVAPGCARRLRFALFRSGDAAASTAGTSSALPPQLANCR